MPKIPDYALSQMTNANLADLKASVDKGFAMLSSAILTLARVLSPNMKDSFILSSFKNTYINITQKNDI